jgi:hypothetical protein
MRFVGYGAGRMIRPGPLSLGTGLFCFVRLPVHDDGMGRWRTWNPRLQWLAAVDVADTVTMLPLRTH